jgi:deoxyribonuclease-4
MDKLRFGTAGIPACTKGNTIQGIKDIKKLNLECLELEFVRGVNIKEDKTLEIKEIAKKNEVVLTAHSPYWINLNSEDKKKFHASISYITQTAKITSLCGGFSICYHAGYYQKQDPKQVYDKIREAIKKIIKEVKEFDDKIWIRPELTGKPTQFGDLDELIKLSQEVEQTLPCIDFAHNFARYAGKKNNTHAEFMETLTKYEKALGKKALQNMHIHMSGINYGEKGEKNHLELKDSDMNYKDLMKVLKEFKCKGVVICESPNLEKDALLMQKTYSSI